MPSLTDADLLEAWERGCSLVRPARSLPLLATISGATVNELAALPLGIRDRRLLALRRRLFGTRFVGFASCTPCGEDIELRFDASNLPVADAPPPQYVRVGSGQARMPTTYDLIAAAAEVDIERARSVLVERCVGIERGRASYEVAEALAASDPFLDLTLTTACTRCRFDLTLVFDIEAFLWAELDAWARRSLRTIATLARAFGWSERDILDMTSQRREAYLRIAVA